MARVRWPIFLGLVAAGCSASPSIRGSGASTEEAAVQAAFVHFQQALEKGNAETIWGSLDTDAQAAAERAAKRVRTDAEKLKPDERAKKAKGLGLSPEELVKLTGKEYLKTPLFLRAKPFDEIPESKFESAAIDGDKATVKYQEEDGDHESLTFRKEGGVWKASPPID
jgi:hypothetical protein